jgi:hypothetical protein
MWFDPGTTMESKSVDVFQNPFDEWDWTVEQSPIENSRHTRVSRVRLSTLRERCGKHFADVFAGGRSSRLETLYAVLINKFHFRSAFVLFGPTLLRYKYISPNFP